MKKLISAHTVQDAYKAGKESICAPRQSTIITPEAYSLAEKLNIQFSETQVESRESASAGPQNFIVDEKLILTIVKQVFERLPQEKRDPELVKNAVVQVLSQYVNQK